jgi:hypothetical protein
MVGFLDGMNRIYRMADYPPGVIPQSLGIRTDLPF